ncbi:hydrogenase expression/formation protein [Roseibium sp. Sym1]|uniref:hydrogenase expression/formation protein n=1 Tax=Roseibium sp. Sym1 TaxID=3016006 RepID=UPI0022B3EDFE|nr:hydrogenase expression/formation protein [Roseibium sp. Sym1]
MSTINDPFDGPMTGPLVGPGSQPQDEDGGVLEYMQMPSGMMTFEAPDLPEPEETGGLSDGLGVLETLVGHLKGYDPKGPARRLDLSHLEPANLDLVNQALGEGEVSVIGGAHLQAQESVLAGVWRVRRTPGGEYPAADYVEVGAFPTEVLDSVFETAQDAVTMPDTLGPNIFNAPPLVPEINEHVAGSGEASGPHVINLSLLPHTEEDLAFLAERLGPGSATILSRGYGNCRISSTGTKNTWWVQFYNSQDALILNSIEIVRVPEVACAAPEDIADSAERLEEILGVYR